LEARWRDLRRREIAAGEKCGGHRATEVGVISSWMVGEL
jgi:hypothetical protein